ncbi:ribose 5-phosphate isomerase B [Candidatus Woesearchaeota archaeon]|nr:ribose 5-phosphate isomerase B [Candidatus Woesearchaeota archaeon]
MLYLGSDHAGFPLKQHVKAFLQQKKVPFKDLGTNNEASCDYPDYAKKVAEEVIKKQDHRGILICGTGIGMSITANKIKGIRAALCYSEYTAEYARKHNNANILCFGGLTTAPELAVKMVDLFIKTPFEGGRHERRIAKIDLMEC